MSVDYRLERRLNIAVAVIGQIREKRDADLDIRYMVCFLPGPVFERDIPVYDHDVVKRKARRRTGTGWRVLTLFKQVGYIVCQIFISDNVETGLFEPDLA